MLLCVSLKCQLYCISFSVQIFKILDKTDEFLLNYIFSGALFIRTQYVYQLLK